MTDEQAPALEAKNRWPWLTIFGWTSTMVAAIAAAVSAWASLQSMEEARAAQLLSRQVDACFDVDRRATAQLSAILTEVHQAAEADAQAAQRGEQFDWDFLYSYHGFTPFQDIPCREGESSEACATRRAEALEFYREVMRISDSAESTRRSLEFASAQTFTLIGTRRLAEAERTLMLSLREVAHDDQEALNLDRRTRIQAAVNAHADFQAACRELTSDYRPE